MDFEWDEAKRRAVIKERDVDLVRAARIFEGPVLQRKDERRDYGETRFVTIGMIEDECYIVVWTPRDDRRRLITAWKGGSDEQGTYETRYPRRDRRDGPAG